MKTLIVLFLATLALASAVPTAKPGGQLHIPDKCEDVLAVKVCDNLVELAKRLKLNAEEVKKAVVEAVKQGKTSSEEIYNAAKDFLMQEVLTKKCEDFLSADDCSKLRKVAAVLKVNAAKVEEFIVKAAAEGAVQAKDIYAKVMEYYKTEIATKKCEDFLSSSQCDQLRKVATKLGIKFDDLEEAVRSAYLKTLGDAKELYTEVIATLKDYALNTKCEDLLNPDLCAALRRYAAITKVQFPVLMEKAVDLLIKGYDVSKALLTKIYNLVDLLYDCTDVFDQPSCDKLYKMATYLGIRVEKVEDFIRKYVPIAVEKGKDIYNNFPEMMKELGKYLKDLWCDKTPFCFSAQSDEMFADDAGFFDLELIKQKIKEYIEIKYPGLQAEIKEKILDLVNKATSTQKLVADAIMEIMFVGGKSAEAIKSILKDLIANIQNIINPSVAPQSDEIAAADFIDFDLMKQKIREYIEEKYPGLEDKVKKTINDVINRATSISSLVVEAAKEVFVNVGESADKIKSILKELVKDLTVIAEFNDSNDMMVSKRSISSFEELKQKIVDFIEKKYPGLQDQAKEEILRIVKEAKNVVQLAYKALYESYQTSKNYVKNVWVEIFNLVKKN